MEADEKGREGVSALVFLVAPCKTEVTTSISVAADRTHLGGHGESSGDCGLEGKGGKERRSANVASGSRTSPRCVKVRDRSHC